MQKHGLIRSMGESAYILVRLQPQPKAPALHRRGSRVRLIRDRTSLGENVCCVRYPDAKRSPPAFKKQADFFGYEVFCVS